jgi:dihydrofolate synthase/folylpolyglutamate synthase
VDYPESLRYLLSFTDFEKLPGSAYSAANFDLRRMVELLSLLGNPHLAPRTIHIAGTKGKGSTAAMIASALSVARYRTGLYTSPHLHTFRERMTVDGEMIEEGMFADLTDKARPAVEEVNRRHEYGELTTFEILTAVAFSFFGEQGVDSQVLEAGLGGRLDATNVVSPELCVITSISRDHAEVLGDTLAKIAGEKAGIIKRGAQVISAPQRPEAAAVIEDACRRNETTLVIVGRDVTWRKLTSDLSGQSFEVEGTKGSYKLTIPLLGAHQLENAATAVAALEALGVESSSIARGLARVSWPGRLEVLRREPVVMVDGAHNADSARRLKEAITEYFDHERLILVIGASSDKDVAGMLAEMAPLASAVIATRSRHPRALAVEPLLDELKKQGVEGTASENVGDAVERALSIAGVKDLVCITGSLFVAAEAREHMLGIPAEVA